MNSIAVLGGTFDPPHMGHKALAQAAADKLGLGRVLLIPTGNPHFKLNKYVTPAEHRVAMCQLLASLDERFEVSLIEAQREGVTYTADTLEELHAQHKDAQLLFIVGGDCAEHIMTWRRAADIARLCKLVVVARAGYNSAAAKQALQECGLGFDVAWIEADVPDVSSTQVRQRVCAGEPISDLVPSEVERYILEHGLYV